ncbi:hypothetical protein AOLI_G00143120 [Acnodon oligacanthus]
MIHTSPAETGFEMIQCQQRPICGWRVSFDMASHQVTEVIMATHGTATFYTFPGLLQNPTVLACELKACCIDMFDSP